MPTSVIRSTAFWFALMSYINIKCDLIFSFSIAAVAGAISRMKPMCTGNVESVFSLAVSSPSFISRVSKCWPPLHTERPCNMWWRSWLKILIVLLLKCPFLSILPIEVDCSTFSPLHLFLRMTVLGLTYCHACNLFLQKMWSLGFCVCWLHFNVVYNTLNDLHGDCHNTNVFYFDCLHLCLYKGWIKSSGNSSIVLKWLYYLR